MRNVLFLNQAIAEMLSSMKFSFVLGLVFLYSYNMVMSFVHVSKLSF